MQMPKAEIAASLRQVLPVFSGALPTEDSVILGVARGLYRKTERRQTRHHRQPPITVDISAAVARTKGPALAISSSVNRATGPDIDTPATGTPCPSNTAEAMQRIPV